MKRTKLVRDERAYKIDALHGGNFFPGMARIVGKRTRNIRPYVNIYDKENHLIASIDTRQMTRLAKGWMECNKL